MFTRRIYQSFPLKYIKVLFPFVFPPAIYTFRIQIYRIQSNFVFTRFTNYILLIFVGEIIRCKHWKVEITNNTVTRKYITKTFCYFICLAMIRNCSLLRSNKYNRLEKKESHLRMQQLFATLSTSLVVSYIQYF